MIKLSSHYKKRYKERVSKSSKNMQIMADRAFEFGTNLEDLENYRVKRSLKVVIGVLGENVKYTEDMFGGFRQPLFLQFMLFQFAAIRLWVLSIKTIQILTISYAPKRPLVDDAK